MFTFIYLGYSSSKVSVTSIPVFPVSSIRRGLPVELPQIIAALLFWGEAASKIPSNSTYCAPLYFPRRSLRLGFWSERFLTQKVVANLLLLRSVLRFCVAWKQRCAQIERLTWPLTPSAYYLNDNGFADINRRNFVFAAAIYGRHLILIRFFGGVLLDKVKSPQRLICKIKRK